MATLDDKLVQLVTKWYLRGAEKVVAGVAPDGRTLISDTRVAVLLTTHPFNLERLVQPNGRVVSEENIKKLLPDKEMGRKNVLLSTGNICSIDRGSTGIQYVDSTGETWYVDARFVKQLTPVKNMAAVPYVTAVGKGAGIVYFAEEPSGEIYGFCTTFSTHLKKQFDDISGIGQRKRLGDCENEMA